MNDFTKIREDIEEIKKQLWYLAQSNSSGSINPNVLSQAVSAEVSNQLTPAITNLQTTILSQISNQMENQISSLSTTLNGNISSTIAALEQTLTGSISSNVSSLQSQIDDLEDSIDALENSSGGSGGYVEPAWTTLYDASSSDPSINLGQTNGVKSSYGVFSDLPDLTPYHRIRLKYLGIDSASFYEYDITADETIYIRLVQAHATGNSIYWGTYQVSVNSSTNKKELTIGNTQKWAYSSSKLTSTSMRTDSTQGLLLGVYVR